MAVSQLLRLAPLGIVLNSCFMNPASKHVIDLYERHAQAFDADRGRSMFERSWLDRFRAAVGTAAPILDVGCGSGEPIAGYLIERGHPVTGVDSSPSLIALAQGRHPRHRWVVGDMRRLDLGTVFGGIVAWDSFFHLTREDQRAMFPLFRAHAAAGAGLLFTSGPADGESIGSYQDEPLYHASLDPDAYRNLLASNGFEVLEHVAEDPECGGHTIWLARLA